MKYIRIATPSGPRWAEETEDKALLLSAAPYLGGEHTGEELPLDGVTLLAPCEASKMVCVGKNYFDHIKEMQESFGAAAPEKPVLFIKP